MKGFRIAVLTAAVAAGYLVVQFTQQPIQAARQATAPPAASPSSPNPGAESYAQRCAICHGDQREGILPAFPPLTGIQHQMNNDKLTEIIRAGKGRMPGFPDVQGVELSALVHYLMEPPAPAADGASGDPSALTKTGGELFHQNCAFCHGRDAMGGESGPDLTESKLVRTDPTGDKIAAVIRDGRPENKMPKFNFSGQEVRGIIAFIHAREAAAAAHPGGRRGVAVSDLQTGKVDAGKQFFDGPGGCVKCHSPQGDLAGLTKRYQGLQLEQQMLYPRGAKSTVIVTLPTGQTVSGTLAYHDEFTVALRDDHGIYRSWAVGRVRYKVDSPVEAHVNLLSKYTDDDIHNLMAYLQTMH